MRHNNSNILDISSLFQCRAPYMVIAEKATERWGAVMKHITTACVIITLYGTCVVVLVLMGDFLTNISEYWHLGWR